MPHKILVIRLSSLGDVVLTTPVHRALKEQWPDCRITVLVKAAYADILEGNPFIDRIISLSSHRGLWACLRQCRQENFDIVIDLHNNLRSWIIRTLCPVPRTLVYRKDRWARRAFVWRKRGSPVLERHTIERYLAVLKRLGWQPRLAPPEIYPKQLTVREKPARILVVQTALLENSVLTTPLLRNLSEVWPQARLSVLCIPETRDIFSGHPGVSDVLVYDKKGAERSWSSIWRFLKRLKSESYDIALLPHRSFRSALLVWLARVPRRIGFPTNGGRWFLTDVVPFAWPTHDLERNLLLLRPLGLEGRSKSMVVPRAQGLDALLAEHGIKQDDLVIGFVPGSVWATKRWLPERFGAVADRLAKDGFRVILIGGKADLKSASEVESSMAAKAENLVGKTSLAQAAAILARCSVVLTNDSGPMHMSVAVGTPTVALFGSTTKELGFFPYGIGHTVIEKELPCRPCGLHGHKKCPLGHFRCMKDITVDEVYEAVTRQLQKARPKLKA